MDSHPLMPPPPPPPPSAAPSLGQRVLHIAGTAGLTVALALASAAPAFAARSGGRMGGSSFGGRSFSSSGAGGWGGAAAAATSRSAWGAGATSGGAWRGSYRSGGSQPLTGGFGSSYSSPSMSVRTNSFFLSPWGFGYGVGVPMYGGGGLLSLLFWGAFAVIMLQVVQGVLRNMSGGDDGYSYGGGGTEGYEEVVTVAKVQVGLLGSAREIQTDLERISGRADTESPEGLHYILQETVLALMRNPDYCLYGFAKSKRERSAEDAETAFNQLSLQERGKFQQETRVNVGGRQGTSSLAAKKGAYAQGDKELIVVTILVAADGSFKMPTVDSRTSLNQALSLLGAVRADDLLAVEVLWTPEEEGDYFTVEDLAYDYPTLNTL
ncbi:hypothetical protein C2E21_4515 [Chlorella sorokiniana]|uniref:DUF1517 domain-containing protein n=1 Tax=Chlorella sorokiniana TaxID=3076 RepID=A0A2P6TR18_CHLSO|nr:hypothetical protein C2E21_4515 [Chlorella sorokiniana]|eukprot:PRW56501.1 hypothetical protein C2E21_4515 [Chlorella sorokiniana]